MELLRQAHGAASEGLPSLSRFKGFTISSLRKLKGLAVVDFVPEQAPKATKRSKNSSSHEPRRELATSANVRIYLILLFHYGIIIFQNSRFFLDWSLDSVLFS